LARIVEDGWVENVYRLQIMNTTESVQHYRISATGLPSLATDLNGAVRVEPAQARWVPVAVRVPPQVAGQAGPGSHRLEFVVERVGAPAEAQGTYTLTEKSTFMVPR
jgi:polyferredoxin